MKKITYLIFALLTFMLAGCSSFVKDLKSVNKGVKYTVVYFKEVIAEYDADGNQINFGKDENDNDVLNYEAFDEEEKHCKEGEIPEILPKEIKGFTAQEVDVPEIEADGSTVINVYYNRNEYTVTLKIGDDEACWNYSQWRNDKENIEKDIEDVVVTGKYESSLLATALGKLQTAGKKSCGIERWSVESEGKSSYVEMLPLTFPSADTIYTAQWAEMDTVKYTVEHWFEKVNSSEGLEETTDNYELDSSLTEIKTGVPEAMTNGEAKTVTGFTAKVPHQVEIQSSGTSVVKIYYNRNSYDLIFNTDEGLWNYDAYKSGTDNEPDTAALTISGKYGTAVPYEAKVNNFADLKKVGKKLKCFESDGKNIEIAKLPSEFPAMNVTYTAVWQDKADVKYTVNFMVENLSSTDDSDEANYSLHSSDGSLKGRPDYNTQAEAKEIPGFTAKEIEQQEILEDGSTVVKVFYKRNTYSVSFNANGGMWNYEAYKEYKVAPDSDDIVVSGKFEEEISVPDVSGLGRTSHNLKVWEKDGVTYTVLPETYMIAAKDEVFKAVWEMGKGIRYTVKHLFQSLENEAVYEELSEYPSGAGLGIQDEDTEAVPLTVTGFTAITPVIQKKILADGSTVVEIKYNRNSYKFTFDAAGGNLSGSAELTGKYGEALNNTKVPSVTKAGWTFGGWKLDGKLVTDSDKNLLPQVFDGNKTFTAYWISTVSIGSISFFGGDIKLNKEQNESGFRCTVTLPAGYETENWSYKWYVDGVFTSDEKVFARQNASLGIGRHTIVLKATLKGNNFTGAVTIDVE